MPRRRKYPRPEEYPAVIPVGNAYYRICFVNRLKEGDLGMCSNKEDGHLILISRDQSPREMYATFWHELLHAFEYETGMKLGHPRIRKLEWLIAMTSLSFNGQPWQLPLASDGEKPSN